MAQKVLVVLVEDIHLLERALHAIAAQKFTEAA